MASAGTRQPVKRRSSGVAKNRLDAGLPTRDLSKNQATEAALTTVALLLTAIADSASFEDNATSETSLTARSELRRTLAPSAAAVEAVDWTPGKQSHTLSETVACGTVSPSSIPPRPPLPPSALKPFGSQNGPKESLRQSCYLQTTIRRGFLPHVRLPWSRSRHPLGMWGTLA